MKAIAIGNGESRSSVNLLDFDGNILVGCNAIQRDIQVDHIVCCDRRMVDEAIKSKNTSNTKIHIRPDYFNFYQKNDKRISRLPELPYEGNTKADMPIHWGSGSYAVLVAANQSVDTVELIGFDLYPVNEKFNNVYKDTKHYKNKESSPIDYSFWEYQISKVFRYFPDKKFIVKNYENWKMPSSWLQSNVSFQVLATKNLTIA